MANDIFSDAFRMRDEFFSRGDALGFYNWVNSMGYDEGDMKESPVLNGYEGMYSSGRKLAQKPAKGNVEARVQEPDSEDIARWARIALRRFPELLPGEHILKREITQRLGALRQAGYPVQAYGKMNATEVWNYLSEVRNNIKTLAQTSCPQVLDELRTQNSQAIADARLNP